MRSSAGRRSATCRSFTCSAVAASPYASAASTHSPSAHSEGRAAWSLLRLQDGMSCDTGSESVTMLSRSPQVEWGTIVTEGTGHMKLAVGPTALSRAAPAMRPSGVSGVPGATSGGRNVQSVTSYATVAPGTTSGSAPRAP
eukprot:scaffold9563_cov62-Phaeocystis_antarctica.AAC.1